MSSFWETLFWPFYNLDEIANQHYIYLVPYGVTGYFLLKDGIGGTIPTQNIILGAVSGTIADAVINKVEESKQQSYVGASIASNRRQAYHNDWNSRYYGFY